MARTIIDATTAQHAQGGIGVVIRGVLQGVVDNGASGDVTVIRGPGLVVPPSIDTITVPRMTGRLRRLAYQRLLMAGDWRLRGRGANALVTMDSYLPLTPVPGFARLSCFVHDVLPLTHPHFFGRANLVPKRAGLRSATRAAAVLTSSEFTARRIYDELGVTARVARFGCGQLADAEADGLLAAPPTARGDFALYVGAIEARKDLPTLINGFGLAQTAQPALRRLALVGNWRTPYGIALRRWVKTLPSGHAIRFLGSVAPADTATLLGRARVLVYPSLAEGFGLPVLEGMATSTPVVASDIPEVRSWAGDACSYFAPENAEELAGALVAASTDRAESLTARGRELSATYRWRTFASELLAAA